MGVGVAYQKDEEGAGEGELMGGWGERGWVVSGVAF